MGQRDILYQIINELSLNDIVRCLTVNRLINHICNLQYARLINDYENILANLSYKSSYKQMYATCYELEGFIKKYADLNLFNFFSTDVLDIQSRNIIKLPKMIG
uniref:F-box domain-containing protein n=1 Tax=viral metagenome TaxID=1070528 RepID=A0A6C0CBJ1_9ZZZZ